VLDRFHGAITAAKTGRFAAAVDHAPGEYHDALAEIAKREMNSLEAVRSLVQNYIALDELSVPSGRRDAIKRLMIS
jgi:hypothetical protein